MEEVQAHCDITSFITEQPKTHHLTVCEGTILANPSPGSCCLAQRLPSFTLAPVLKDTKNRLII